MVQQMNNLKHYIREAKYVVFLHQDQLHCRSLFFLLIITLFYFSCHFACRLAHKLDEVEALERNLEELQEEYWRQQEQKRQESDS